MAKLISGRYADALFSIAVEENKVDEFEKQSEFVLEVFKNNEEFVKIINHPQIGSDKKQEMMESIFKGKISNEMLGLFTLVLRKNRETELEGILEAFLGKVMEYKGITNAYVYSAVKLKDSQLESIKEKLSKNLNKQIIIHTEIDPNLIGGLKISVDGTLIDGTVSKQLSEIRKSLLNISAQ